MCGIVGIYGFKGLTINEHIVNSMRDTLIHRGPDGYGNYIHENIALGHRRLSIIDVSQRGSQPMCNENKTIWLTYNGEIYNFEEIKRLLSTKGHVFKSDTDSEVIIHAYEEWGHECLERFNGMFAFAIWDSNNKKLWLVRDRLGIKPLFYHSNQHFFAFGSEIKAILAHPDINRTVNQEALSYYLSLNWVPAPHTMFENIFQVLPGHHITIDQNGNLTDSVYWELGCKTERSESELYWANEFDSLMYDSVKLRSRSDVPFGAFLSGGMDSSSISYWLNESVSDRLKTFSIGFKEISYNELQYAKKVANVINSKHHEFVMSSDIMQILPKITYHSEEPTADSSMLALYHLSQETRKHVTVVQSGDGADEILAGYETYQANYLASIYRRLPNILKKRIITPLVNAIPSSDKKISSENKAKRFINGANLSGDDAHASWRIICNDVQRGNLLKGRNIQPTFLKIYQTYFSECPHHTILDRALWVDTKLYLPNDMLTKVDRMSMAHGLEARVPFLDHRVVEFCNDMPENLKLHRFRVKKYLLKKVMQHRLPPEIINRKKAGFNMPISSWIKGSMKEYFFDHLRTENFSDLVDLGEVDSLLNSHIKGKCDNSHQIWGLLVLKLWNDKFLKK